MAGNNNNVVGKRGAEDLNSARKTRLIDGNNGEVVAVKMENDNPPSTQVSPNLPTHLRCGGDKDLSNEEWEEILRKKRYIAKALFTAEGADYTLIITGGSSTPEPAWRKDDRAALRVSTTKLDAAMPNWRSLMGKNRDCISTAGGLLNLAHISTGTPVVFQHLIAAAHHSPTESNPTFIIKEDLGLEQLRDLAKLSHELEALQLIASNVPAWVEKLYPPDWSLSETTVARAGSKGSDDSGYCGQLEHIWIAYEFGLESIFDQICFNLAYVAKASFSNPDSLPPGIYDEIYNRRTAYVSHLMSEISAYRQKLVEATNPGTQSVSKFICSGIGGKERECARRQLEELDKWLSEQSLDVSKDTLQNSEGRSPINFFATSSPTVPSIDYYYYHDGKKCGLGKLVKKDGQEVLMQWLASFDGRVRIATDKHIEYMRGQRKKYEK